MVSGRAALWLPTLFNLYGCVVIEAWLERVKEVDGVGTCILYKLDQQLFSRSTRGADHAGECQFADDVALLATTTRESAEVASKEYQPTASDFGLTVRTVKTNFMVVALAMMWKSVMYSQSVWTAVRLSMSLSSSTWVPSLLRMARSMRK